MTAPWTLTRTLDALERGGHLDVPVAEALCWQTQARWMHLEWMRRSARWAPLVCLSLGHLTHEVVGWEVARGGWLALDGPLSALDGVAGLEVLRDAAADGELTLLTPSSRRTLQLDVDPAQAQLAAHFHDVAGDPALEALRRSLLSHCQNASVIHLRGAFGVGKQRLVRWAHATLDDRPLAILDSEDARPLPGQWVLAEEITSLGPIAQARLAETLRAASPTPRGWVPPRRRRPRPPHPALRHIIGEDPALVALLHMLVALGPRQLPVLLTGEPGVGKEALARALHALSGRKGAFVAVDMGALSEQLFESELFGHRRGAFTDARADRPGAFVRASGGTIFLDEIGNLPLRLQVKLLRVLQERAVRPVGADEVVPVDARVVTATNADCEALARRGLFRVDLLSRLNAATLHVPPLRERLDDLDRLARHLLARHRVVPPDQPWCTPEVTARLRQHTWPGNVRELAHLIDLAAALTPDEALVRPDALGPLSPEQQRAVPILSTCSSDDARHLTDGLDPQLAQSLTVTTLNVPTLRDRPAASRRHLLLHGLAGRPITRAALRTLEEYAWWGNLRELEANLAVLNALPPGPVTLQTLEAALPHLVHAPSLAPIHLVIAPTRGAGDALDGLMREVDSGAVLLGRTPSWDALTRAAREGDARAQSALQAITARVPSGASVACLELPFLRRLSRAHALVVQTAQGLVAHKLPGVRMQLLGRALDDDAPVEITEDTPGVLGEAGELRVVHPRTGELVVQVFAFAGAAAMSAFAEAALSSRVERAMTTTLTDTGDASSPAPAPTARPHRWALSEAETHLLAEILLSFPGGLFKHHVALCLAPHQESREVARLVAYLRQAPRMSQYIARLVAWQDNAALRELLRERAARLDDRERWLARLPVGVRRCLDDGLGGDAEGDEA